MGLSDAIALPMEVPRGQVATIVTHLEMLERPVLSQTASRLTLVEWARPAVADYLALFRAVGEPWLWTSRPLMAEADVESIIHHPQTDIYRVRDPDAGTIGFVELDFRDPGQCEISFFGLIAGMNGKGHGRWMMNQALDRAWRDGITRVWLHSCTQDSPRALPFYQRCGFRIFRQQMDMMADPRLSGDLPATAAPHVPVFR